MRPQDGAEQCRRRTQDAKAFYIEGAVDNFLDHSYGNAMGMYWLFLLARAAEKCPSVPHFLQVILAYVPEGDPDLGKIKTPWGTPYVGWPPAFKEADVVRIAEQLLKDTTEASSGEGALLCMLLREPLVACECLRTEDPYDERFGKKPAQGTGKLRKKPHAYMMDCAKCYKMPQGGDSFPLCKRCRRVRYCGVECQRADWPRHKVECGKKRADWWGRAPLASRKQLQEQGLM